ncbi:MAG: PAS domain-containing protein, partial [Actinomycetota bacterium]|nr:PAS domain-containing protein [Actinomycetota bacterium]
MAKPAPRGDPPSVLSAGRFEPDRPIALVGGAEFEPLAEVGTTVPPVNGIDLPTLDLLPDGVLVADHDGVVVAVNAAAGKVAGLDPAASVGRELSVVLPLLDDEGRSWWIHSQPFDGIR